MALGGNQLKQINYANWQGNIFMCIGNSCRYHFNHNLIMLMLPFRCYLDAVRTNNLENVITVYSGRFYHWLICLKWPANCLTTWKIYNGKGHM